MSPAEQHACLQQAAHWFAELHGEAPDPLRQRQWQHWLHAHPQHRVAWQQVQQVWDRFATLSPAATEQALTGLRPARRRALRQIGGVLGVAGLSLLGLQQLPMQRWQAAQRTAFARTGRWTLPDGGTLWLNGDSAADIDYNADQRCIVLHRGELLLQTAADHAVPARPMRVRTPLGELQALGTRFSVCLDAAAARVNVYQGQVVLRPSAAPAVMVEAGSQRRFHGDAVEPASSADPLRGTWLGGQLLADAEPLQRVVTELARYRRGHLGCDPRVAGLRLVAALPLDDSDRALQLIAAVLPVRIERILPWWVTLVPA